MKPSRPFPDRSFVPAPTGGRVRLVTRSLLLALPALAVVDVAIIVFATRELPMVVYGLPVAISVFVFAMWRLARIHAYRLADGALVVERALLKARFPLDELAGVTFEPGATRRALKVAGNGGLGAMAGRFRNKQLGKFRAYLSDSERAVVLRWPQQTVVVSPRHVDEFIAAVKERAQLPR